MAVRAIWSNPPDCVDCINSGFAPPGYCPICLKQRREEVRILYYGDGLNFGKVIIERKDGQLRKVDVKELILRRKGE